MSDEVFILSAVRTPIGSFCGSLASLQAHELGALVIIESVNRAKVNPDEITEVIFGHTLTAGQGQNPVRQAAVMAGLPVTMPATSVNMICGSGLKAVILGTQTIKAGDSDLVVVGGQESMSQAQHSIHMRNGTKMGQAVLVDTMIKDGLTDAFNDIHMGITAENIVKKWKISREEQDQYSLLSQQKAAAAQNEKLFEEEIVPVTIQGRKVITVSKDEYIKHDSTIEGLRVLRPVFIRDGTGTVTAGNASGLNDGAAALVLGSKSYADAKGLNPLARIVSYASSGVDPLIMGTGPIPAVRSALTKAGWTVNDVDYFELNEAFAAQSIVVAKELNIPAQKVNVNGGAIALGHPLGASGGGQGVALCVELV
ncbi:unnamed protein product [Allacma fusca]|uniref:Acetyl-CoA acetyltransferase n=1 Tax=Allacma fusca TaxID=39272 RepID=A0A8J2KD00_9HEXA|nr:unnamed protein product [Allacma fusca]